MSATFLNSLAISSNKREVNEDHLVARCYEGDYEAFSGLFYRYRFMVAGLVHKLVGNPADSDEIIQDVFVAAFRSIRSFKGKSQFSTWLYKIGINVCRQYIRSRGRRLRRDAQSIREVDNVAGSRTPDGEQQAIAGERQKQIRVALEKLNFKKRVVVVLHDMEGKTMEQIAEIIKVPVGTVKSRLFHGRDELRSHLADLL